MRGKALLVASLAFLAVMLGGVVVSAASDSPQIKVEKVTPAPTYQAPPVTKIPANRDPADPQFVWIVTFDDKPRSNWVPGWD